MFKSKINNLSLLNQTILKSGFWILLGTIISKGLLLLTSILIVKFVNKSVYGEFGIIKSTINMFTVFAGMGLGLTATKYISQYKVSDPQKTGRIIGLSNLFSIALCIIFGGLFIIFSPELAQQINAPGLSNSLKLGAVILIFSGLDGIQTGILAGFQKFRSISTNSVISSVISSVFQIIGAYYIGLNGILLGFGLNFFSLYILNYYSIKRITKGNYNYSIFSKANLQELPLIWRFSIPAVLSGIMISPVVWLTNKFLVDGTNGYHAMADFDIASQWRATVLFIPGALSQIALPLLASAENKTDFNKIMNKNLLLNLIIAAVVAFTVILILPLIIKLYGASYQSAQYPTVIMLTTTILVAVNNIVGNAIAGMDKMWLGFLTNFLWAVVLISTAYYFVSMQDMGAVGLSYAYLISYISHTLVQYLLYRFYLVIK